MTMDIGFGKTVAIPLNDLSGVSGGGAATGGTTSASLSALYEYINQILDVLDSKVDITAFNKWYSDFIADAWFRKLTVVEQLLIPTWV